MAKRRFQLSDWAVLILIGSWAISVHPAAFAQVTTATISGTVKDETEAVLPGVAMAVKNLDTGIVRTIVTDEEGRYKVPNLALANYEIQAELPGFQTEVRSGIKLTVGREAIVDFRLKVGEITEKVVVTGEAPLIQQTTSSLSALIEQRTITDLPLNGRNYMQLTILQPVTHQIRTAGVAPGQGAKSVTTGMGLRFSTAGARDKQNLYLLDGTQQTDVTGSTPGTVSGISFGVDTIREFQILSSAYSAEFGGRSGGVINVVSGSGTNAFHGSLFYFHRNDDLDARNFFDPVEGPPEFKRNQFGFTVGGPIRRDNTFFLGSYERFRERLGTTLRGRTPTAAAREGRLASGTVAVNPAMRPYLSFYPLPNGRDFGDGTGELIRSFSQPTDEDFSTVKIDHQLSDRDRFSGRYAITDGETQVPDVVGTSFRQVPLRSQSLNVDENRIFSPSLLNTFRFGFNRSRSGQFQVQLADFSPDLLLYPKFPKFGELTVTGLSSLLGGGASQSRQFVVNLFHFAEQLAYTRGRHSTKFGFDIRRFQFNYFQDSWQGGRAIFTSLPDFLAARPSSAEGQLTEGDTNRGYRQSLFGFYVQEDFQWTQRFTLNLGLRYEFITIPLEVNGKTATVRNLLTDTDVTVGPFFGRNPSLRNFAPRIGVAWDPFGGGKTSLRAGLGVFHDEITSNYYVLESVSSRPFAPRGSRVNPPFPRIFEGFAGEIPLTAQEIRAIEYRPPQPVRYHYQLEMQREIGQSVVLNVGYVGSRSNHLARQYDSFNQAVPQTLPDGRRFYVRGLPRRNPAFGALRVKDFASQGFYNGLHAGITKRFSEGLGLQLNYSLGKSVDDSSVTFDTNEMQQTTDIPFPDDRKSDRGLSDFHVGRNFAANFIYELPLGRGKEGAWARFVKGWQVNGLITLASGFPFHPLLGFDRGRALAFRGGEVQRPDLLPGKSNNPVLGSPDRYFDPTAFALPEEGFLGNLGRNTIVGPGVATFDLALFKNIAFQESGRLQFRAEFFNLFNRPNFGLPNQQIFSRTGLIGSVGRITDTSTTSRQIQFGLKFLF